MSSFTPGPWEVEAGEPGYWNIKAKYGALDVQPATAHGLDDAHLIAAAPELVKVVRELLGADEDDTWDTDREWLRNAARAVLAKVKGGRP